MAFNKDQFKELITDVLKKYDLFSASAVELLMLTAAVESNFGTYIKQVRGPALGVFQMEPTTHNDIWNNYISYKRDLHKALTRRSEQTLRHDLEYAILMTRVHYLRVPERLPKASSPEDLAGYWKKHYNTHLGKGTVLDAMRKYRKYCT